MAIRAAKIASMTDEAVNPHLKIQPSDINPFTEPGTPTNEDIWFEVTGTTPNRFIRIKVRDLGVWKTVAEIQF